MEKYRRHLSQILALFISDDQINVNSEVELPKDGSLVDHILLSEDNMRDYWIPAVTHVSYDVKPENNWENLELLGDGYADSAFTRLFMTRYPGQTQLFYSETRNYYLGNEYIAEISRDTLMLGPFIHTKVEGEPTNSMFADCFESFCGALVLAGDRNYLGFGLILIEYFITHIFGNVNVSNEYDRTFGKSSTQLEQIMRRIGLDPIQLNHRMQNYTHSYQYVLNRKQIEGLNALIIGKQIPVKEKLAIGTAEGKSKHLIKDEAADKAFAYLKKYGIDTPWSINIKNHNDLKLPSLRQDALKAITKAKRAGYTTIMFREIDKSDEDDFIVILLLGVKPDGKQESLDVVVVNKQNDTMKRSVVIVNGHKAVLEHYLNA